MNKMRIVSIHIYGFGKFIDKQFNLAPSQGQLFFGENEAGKSTILAFIRAIFFGFPSKQSKEERYEPKLSSAYGGRITLETEQYGRIEIERIKGRSKGDVKVYMPDGTVSGEEKLKEILVGIDRTVYQGVFSFGLQDLNDVSQVQSEELGKYLYGVGMVGRNSIVALEKELAKKQDDLFKPQGKKPAINHLLNEIEQINKKMMELKEEELKYHELIEEKERIRSEIKEKEKKIQLLQSKMKKLEMLERIKPYVIKRNELQNQRKQYDNLLNDFPPEGGKLLDELRIKIEALDERLVELEKRKEIIQHKLKQLNINETIIQSEGEMKAFQQNIGKLEQINVDMHATIQAIADENQQLTDIIEQLGASWDTSKIEQTVTTVQVKDELKELVREEKRLLEGKERLTEDIQQRELYLTEKKQQCEQLREKLANYRNKENIQQELQVIYEALKERALLQQEIAILKAEQLRTNDKKKKPLLLYVGIVLFVMLATYGVFVNEWFIAVVSVISVVILLMLIKENFSKKAQGANDSSLQQKLARYEQLEAENLEEKEKNLSLQLEQIANLERQLEQMESQYDFEADFLLRMKQKLVELHKQLAKLEHDVIQWCEQNKFPAIKKAQLLHDVYTLVVDGKKHLAAINERNSCLREWERFEQQFLQQKRKIAEIIHEDPQLSHFFIAENSLQKLEREKKKLIEKEQLKQQLAQIEEELMIQQEKKAYFEKEQTALFRQANVDNEQQFREQAEKFFEMREIDKELVRCVTDLMTLCPDEEKLSDFERNILHKIENENTYEEISRELEKGEDELKQLENKHIEISVKLEQLEEATTYSEVVQQFEMKKAELKDKVKDWAIYRLSLKLIEDAKRVYETERQPFVIKKAQQFFSIMTDGEYEQLFAPVEENTFIVQNKNGLRFTPSELSQGTREQLYLALRLALASAYQQYVSFPIILDDIFVNFDAKRAKAAKNVIVEMAKDHQIIFFTCHEHMCSLFSEFAIFRM